MTKSINPKQPSIQPKHIIEPPTKTPSFCFCDISQDKDAVKILNDKINCRLFVKSLFRISTLKTIDNIRKCQGLNFEPLQKPKHSIRINDDYRLIFDFESMHFILKTIKHKNKYKNNYIQ